MLLEEQENDRFFSSSSFPFLLGDHSCNDGSSCDILLINRINYYSPKRICFRFREMLVHPRVDNVHPGILILCKVFAVKTIRSGRYRLG